MDKVLLMAEIQNQNYGNWRNTGILGNNYNDF